MAPASLLVWLFAGCDFTGASYSFCPWHQLLQVIVFVLRQLFENINKIFEWIQIVRFCGLDQAEYRCSCLCSRRGFTEQEILPRDDKWLDAPFGSIVAALKPSVKQECTQCLLLVLAVNDPVTELSFDDVIRIEASDPLEIFIQNRKRFFFLYLQPFLRCLFSQVAVSLNGKDPVGIGDRFVDIGCGNLTVPIFDRF